MFGILEAVAVPRTSIFSSFEDLFSNVTERMEKGGYKIIKASTRRRYNGGPDIPNNDVVRCDMVCDRGGRPFRSTATKNKTSTKKTGCPWKARANYQQGVSGWVLTVVCDEHNHEPAARESPSPDISDTEENEEEQVPTVPSLGAQTSEASPRLTGDNFDLLKAEYRQLSHIERAQMLSSLQLRIAAMYAVQSEQLQRQFRREARDKRRLESSRKKPKKRPRVSVSRTARHEAETQQLPGQIQPDSQVSGQQLMEEAQFRLDHTTVPTEVPLPNMGIPEFQRFANHSRRNQGLDD